MNSEIFASTERAKARVIKYPEYSEWQCLMFGTDGWKWRPLKGKEPNWFWRKMQYLILGNEWVKDPTEKSE